MSRRIFLTALLLFAGASSVLSAQQTDTVRGRLVDADGQAIRDERVVLHRVAGATGANIAETRSDGEGRFVIPVDSANQPDAVYFLAARWDGELYIGEAFRAPFADTEHVLQVGVPGTSASALIEGTGAATQMPTSPAAGGGSPATRTSWLLFAVPVIALLGVALYFLLRTRTAVSPRRALLREVAELDLQHAGSATDEYRAARAELIARLRDTPA